MTKTKKTYKIATRKRPDTDGLGSDLILTYKLDRYEIGGVAEGEKGRKFFGGPMVPGPWHYIFGLCSVIAANPENGTYGEMKRAKAAGLVHPIEPGDGLLIDGLKYEVVKTFNGVLKIEEVK